MRKYVEFAADLLEIKQKSATDVQIRAQLTVETIGKRSKRR